MILKAYYGSFIIQERLFSHNAVFCRMYAIKKGMKLVDFTAQAMVFQQKVGFGGGLIYIMLGPL